MGIPEIGDRRRMGPTEALRAVFTGIGKIIMTADRPQAAGAATRERAPGRNGAANAFGHDRKGAGLAAGPGSRWRSLDQTGNVRLLSADDLDDGYEPGSAPEDAESQETAAPAAEPMAPVVELVPAPAVEVIVPVAEEVRPSPVELVPPPAAEPIPPAASEAGVTAEAGALPLASYDTLSLASIRARLRGLDTDQLRVLLGYEQTHAERPEVLGMFERRIEKLEIGR